MRVLFVADGRSPIALNWIRHFTDRGDEVFLASTFACSPNLPLREIRFTPVAFSGARSHAIAGQGGSGLGLKLRGAVRHALGPLTVRRSAQELRRFIQHVQPDLVHAMRIPFEGMLAADGRTSAPLVISVWGNDFTLHAPATPLMRHYTHWTMAAADGLHADCQRDARLARKWGLASERPSLVVPGSGGIRSEVFHPAGTAAADPIVINPRGARAYVRTDVFLRAIPHVLRRVPAARFLCVALEGDRNARQMIATLGIDGAVQLLPHLEQSDLAELLRRSQVMVSPSTHDGTPNSLLEAMACGCLPVVGDLESIREWINDGQNGLLVPADDADHLAAAIVQALENKNLRNQAAGINQELIRKRAQYGPCMQRVVEFYDRVMTRSTAAVPT